MKKIKIGSVVARKSYNEDVIFYVEEIVRNERNIEVAILKGVVLRIKADAYMDDLIIIENSKLKNRLKSIEDEIQFRLKRYEIYEKRKNKVSLGKILHLDGDRKYGEKSSRYYNSMGLPAIVKSIAENKQPFYIKDLILKFRPDIVVITGHDGMLKKESKFNDINNYRNSKYFIASVRELRRIDIDNKIVVFAGACQSYYEEIIRAGANFASSPARILIDFIDPLIVASRVATTDSMRFITMNDLRDDLRDGEKGISGIGARGKRHINI